MIYGGLFPGLPKRNPGLQLATLSALMLRLEFNNQSFTNP